MSCDRKFNQLQVLNSDLQKIRTAMVHAVDSGNIDVIRTYLDQGVDPNIKAADGVYNIAYGIFSLASECMKSNECIKLLVERGLDITDDCALLYLKKAINARNFEIADFLLDKGVDINASLRSGERMLTVAIHENWGKKVEYLLDHGANVEGSEFHDQRTPLMMAAECETNEYILALLLDRNANINAQDFHGKTALIHATEVGRSKTVQYLLTRRADRTIVDHKGFDALHYARLRKSSIFVELLG